MFKIEYIKLNYFDTSIEPTLYVFGQFNNIFGRNNVGKTVMVKSIDFVLGKSKFNFALTQGLENIANVEALVTNDGDKLFLKRKNSGECAYKITEDSHYIDVPDEIYKDTLSEFLNRGINDYLDEFYLFAGENLSCRAFSFLNFIKETDLGNISNIFMSTDSFYNQNRIRQIMIFLFNYSNVKQIIKLKKDISKLEDAIKQKTDIISKYNYLLNQIRLGMTDLQLKCSDDVDSMLTEFINFKDGFMRENANSKVATGDLTVLMKISCSLAEELKYQKNLERQYVNLRSRNERTRKLLSAFKEILQYDTSYACYIEEINQLIEKQITNNEILSYKDFTKTIAAIEKKKSKIDEQIKACNIGLNKNKYEDIWKIIGRTEQNFAEIKKIPQIDEYANLTKQLEELKKALKKLNKEFDNNVTEELNQIIASYYERLKGKIQFATEDYSKEDFGILFNPISVSLLGKKFQNDKTYVYMPGSNARMTTWQVLAYLAFFKMIDIHYPTLPIMRVLIIDGLNQPFDEEKLSYPTIYNLIRDIAQELEIQLFIVSTKKSNEHPEDVIDISTGFNKLANKN